MPSQKFEARLHPVIAILERVSEHAAVSHQFLNHVDELLPGGGVQRSLADRAAEFRGLAAEEGDGFLRGIGLGVEAEPFELRDQVSEVLRLAGKRPVIGGRASHAF